MTEDTPTATPRKPRLARIFIPAAAILIVCVGVLYVMAPPSGKAAEDAKTCAATRAIAARLEPFAHGEVAALSVAAQGKPLPDLVFDGPDGAKTSLASFHGRNVLVNLWATWCVPCRQEMPALDHLQAAFGSKDFTVVAINIDTTRLDRPKAFLKDVGVKNLALYADSKADVLQILKRDGKVVGLPTTILVGRDGCEIGTMAGPAQWDSPEALALLSAAQG